MGRSQSRDSFAAVRYAVDTGSMPPQPKRSLWARKRVILPVAAVTLLGAGFLASESRRQPDTTATATLDCTSARDVWRPACRPDKLQDWVAKAASARDDAPAATGTVDDAAKRASTPKRVVEAAKRAEPETALVPVPQLAAPAAEPATPAKAPPRVAAPATPPEPARKPEAAKPEAAKPAPEPVRAAEAKSEPLPAAPAAKLPEPQPVQQVAKSAEPQPARPAPPPGEPARTPEPQPVQQTAKLVEPQPATAAPPVEQATKPAPQPTVTAEPPRRPAPAPVKVAEEPAASAPQVESKARQKRLAERAARREAARTAALAERRLEPRVIVVRPDIEELAPPRRLARVRPAEQGVRTTAHFPPGFVQALRHYNTRYAYGY